MKIIFIANIGQKYDAARYYLSERRIYNGFVRNGHDVWFFGDREEIRALSPFGLRSIGKKRVNEKLLKVIDNFQPDAIFMLNANIITPETLAMIKEKYPTIKLAQIIYDALFVTSNRHAWQQRLDYVDCHFFTTAGAALKDFSVQGRSCYFIPNMTDKAIDTGQAFALENPAYDVACIMGYSRDREEQQNMLLSVRQELPQIRFCYRGFGGEAALRGADYIAALGQSAIGLNLSHSQCEGDASDAVSRYLYSSDRIAQLTGNGCLVFSEDIFGLEDLYNPDEAVYFSGKEELKEKIQKYSMDVPERQRIAKNGWVKAHTELNTDLVTRYMLERLFDQPLTHHYIWPVEAVTR